LTDMNPVIKAEIKRLADPALSEDDLFVMLAQSAGLGADEIDPAGEGKLQFSRIWQRVGSTVCANGVVKAYIGNPTMADATTVSAQIINLLSEIEGINVVVVAALAMRIGLRTLCARFEETPPSDDDRDENG